MGLLLLIQVVLILLNAVFAGAEIALLSVNEAKLAKLVEQGNRKAKRVRRLTEQPARFLATIQVAITLAGFLGSALAAENFSDRIVEALLGAGFKMPRATLETLVIVAITLVLSYVTLIFGELVPKRIAMKKADSLALGLSGPLTLIAKVFAPVVWLLSLSTNGVLRLFGVDPNEEEEAASEEDIRLMVEESDDIEHEEKEFIHNVFEFNDLTAGEIVTHRKDMDLLWMEDPMEEWENIIHDTRHTRYPICENSQDNIIGVLNAKDYFRLKDRSRDVVMEHAVYEPYFVPESVKADALFRDMRKSKNPISIVLDEYGGCVGMITYNDLLEQLVGAIEDEDD